MSPLLLILFILTFQSATTITKSQEDPLDQAASTMDTTDDGAALSNDCPPSFCGAIEIRFPFSIESSPRYCQHSLLSQLNLSCTHTRTLLLLSSSSHSYTVTAIDYASRTLILARSSWPACPWLTLDDPFDSSGVYDAVRFSAIRCSTKLLTENGSFLGPIACLGGGAYSVYVVNSDSNRGGMTMDWLPVDCTTITNGFLPSLVGVPLWTFRNAAKEFDGGGEVIRMGYYDYGVDSLSVLCHGDGNPCWRCATEGGSWGYNRAKNQTFCLPPVGPSRRHTGLLVALVTGLSIAALIVAISVTIMYKISQKTSKARETRRKVEQFLASYKSAKPTRYSYSGIRKITKQFKQKLGQGGYGSVYKGVLPKEIPVAVKMLEISGSDGEEFINEVSTIGRIHHVNVVRLLGFCSEGTRRALVYEFMPNKSLDKFIFSDAESRARRPFSMQKLLEIAVGIAQGIEYLHQGCNQRILHFDIKPHNILLDHDFNPKISDFGLAKICSKDQSIVTMTAARGTMGYIAPEIYSRNFGTVSYKSDVYSFGMLTLEMVSGRRNIDPMTGNQTEDYFPEWIYDRLIEGEDLGLDLEMDCDEELRKLAMIALWCIQWSPADRPSMTRVVQMLMGNLQSLEMPP